MALTLGRAGPIKRTKIMINFVPVQLSVFRARPTLHSSLLSPSATPASLNAGALPVQPAATEPCLDLAKNLRWVQHIGTHTGEGWANKMSNNHETFYSCSTICIEIPADLASAPAPASRNTSSAKCGVATRSASFFRTMCRSGRKPKGGPAYWHSLTGELCQ